MVQVLSAPGKAGMMRNSKVILLEVEGNAGVDRSLQEWQGWAWVGRDGRGGKGEAGRAEEERVQYSLSFYYLSASITILYLLVTH